MTRPFVLGALIVCSAATIAAAGLQGRQGEDPKIATIENVKDNLYLIRGGAGGNTAAFITERGVILVDTKYPEWSGPILEKVKSVTSKPVTTIINTHTHADHTGSNTEFPATVEFVAHANTRANMEKATCTPVANCAAFKGANAKFLPKTTFKDKLSILSGKDRIDLYYFGRGHTDGDAIVVFPATRTAQLGDLFARKAPPNIDVDNGGSGVEFPDTLAKAVSGIPDVTTLIPGHSALMVWKDLVEFAAYNREFLEGARAALKQGLDAGAAAAKLDLSSKYKDYEPRPEVVKRNVEAIYRELGK